jgi:hypothetical protein
VSKTQIKSPAEARRLPKGEREARMEQAKRNAEANRDSHHKSTDSCRYAWMQTCNFVMTVTVKSLLRSEDGNTF